MHTQTVLTYHRPYWISLFVQSFVPNVQNLAYPSTLPNVIYREQVIPKAFIPFIEIVMEKNLVGFPYSMYRHVEPYTPYFSSGNKGIGNVLTLMAGNLWMKMMSIPKESTSHDATNEQKS